MKLLGCVALVALAGCHPWFASRFPWEDAPDPDTPPVLTNDQGTQYVPGTPSWVPLIDNCMIAGGTRAECIDRLPEADKERYLEWERAKARGRYL